MLCCEILWSLNRCFFLVSGCNLLNLRRIAGDIPLKCVRGTCVRAVAVWRRVLVSEPPSNKTEAWSELLSYDGSASTQNIPASAAARSVHCPLSTVHSVHSVHCPQHGGGEYGDVRMVMGTQRSSSVLGLVISVCSVRWPAAQARTTHYSVLPLTHWFSEFSELGRLGEAFSQKSIFSPDSSEDAALAATHRHKQMKISSKVKS